MLRILPPAIGLICNWTHCVTVCTSVFLIILQGSVDPQYIAMYDTQEIWGTVMAVLRGAQLMK